MSEAAASIPWLPLSEAVARVARHRGCAPEAAELQIVDAGKGDRIKARGVIEGQSVPLQIVGEGKSGRITVATMKPRDVSCEITNVELCFIDLIAAGLLPAPAEKARWSAAEAIAYFVKDVPLSWEAWQGAGASPAELEQAEIDLAQAIGDGVPAWGRPSPFAPERPIPADDFYADMIEAKRPRLGRPKVIVRIDGTVGVSPPQRSEDYKGSRWSSIKVDSAALRQACPRPLTARAEPAPDVEDHGEAAAAAAEERRGARDPLPETRRPDRPHLRLLPGVLPARSGEAEAPAQPPAGGRPTDRDRVFEEAGWGPPIERQKTKPWITNEAVQMK